MTLDSGLRMGPVGEAATLWLPWAGCHTPGCNTPEWRVVKSSSCIELRAPLPSRAG